MSSDSVVVENLREVNRLLVAKLLSTRQQHQQQLRDKNRALKDRVAGLQREVARLRKDLHRHEQLLKEHQEKESAYRYFLPEVMASPYPDGQPFDVQVFNPTPGRLVVHTCKTVCGFCHLITEQATYKRCGRCRSISYCNTECQRRDWNGHRQVCRLSSGSAT